MGSVFAEIDLPRGEIGWRSAMHVRAHSQRQVLRHHSWALPLLESRTSPGPANLRHHDAVLGVLETAGFPTDLAAHAYSVLDSYVYGFVLTEASLPFDSGTAHETAQAMLTSFADDEYPNLVAFVTNHLAAGYDYAEEFDFGLELILDGLEHRLSLTPPGR